MLAAKEALSAILDTRAPICLQKTRSYHPNRNLGSVVGLTHFLSTEWVEQDPIQELGELDHLLYHATTKLITTIITMMKTNRLRNVHVSFI